MTMIAAAGQKTAFLALAAGRTGKPATAVSFNATPTLFQKPWLSLPPDLKFHTGENL
jgi:hypothetical protein